jgi:glycosyltransferase involved in cell wall biosynthesis
LPLQRSPSIPDVRVSVIIPTYESAGVLERCLKSLDEQSWHVDEVIVVDGFSRDCTREIASSLGAKVLVASGTQAAARNMGLADARGNYVLFLDSDQQLDRSVVEECVSACIMQNVEAVIIPEIFVGVNFWGACSALWKNNMLKTLGNSASIPRFYKRSILLASGAFSGKLRFWEDLELYQRLKLKGLREGWCKSHIIHYEADSLRNVIRKYVSYGQSMAEFGKSPSKAPYASTFRLTLSTIKQVLRNPGTSLSVVVGCSLAEALKGFSMVFGLLSRLQ